MGWIWLFEDYEMTFVRSKGFWNCIYIKIRILMHHYLNWASNTLLIKFLPIILVLILFALFYICLDDLPSLLLKFGLNPVRFWVVVCWLYETWSYWRQFLGIDISCTLFFVSIWKKCALKMCLKCWQVSCMELSKWQRRN